MTVAAVGAGVLAVQARVAGIEARINALRAPAPPAAAAAESAGAPTSFDAALGQATAALGTSAGSSAAAGDVGSAAVAAGAEYLGVPYLWGGTDPAKGLDCSGFVQRAYRDVGVELPRVSRDQARAGQPVASLAEARPGDLVAFGSPVDHIGIYVGDGRMIVAPHTGDVVKYQDITRTPTAIRRVAPAGTAAVATGAVAAAGTVARAATAAAAGAASAGSAGTVAAFGAGRLASAGTSRFAPLFADAAARHGVPAALLDAVAKHESSYDATAVSPAGAQGLMQIMPSTARGLGVDPLDPAQAVDGAARLLAGHLQKYDGSIDLALAAYNAGPGAVAKYGGVPPYDETRTYIARITSTLRSAA